MGTQVASKNPALVGLKTNEFGLKRYGHGHLFRFDVSECLGTR